LFAKNRFRLRRSWIAAAMLLGTACTSVDEPASLDAPTEVQAIALGLNAVRVTWKPVEGVSAYLLERRTDLTGPFETIAESVRGDGSSTISYFDTTVEPERFYGYRVRAIGALNARSGVSTVAGARTASVPGIQIRLATTFATPASADADGFLVSVRGPRDTTSYAVAINGVRMITPLPKGSYTIVLRGLAVNCNPTTLGDTIATVQVSDEGINTVGTASFSISCRDPKKASIVTTVRTAGDTVDADGVLMTVSGIIREAGTPANERVYFQSRTLQGVNPAARFDDLRPGDYEVSINDVESPCVLEGERKRTLQPKALAVDTIPFVITCRKPVVPVDTAGRPLVLRHTWSAATARPGDKVSLLTALDMRARPSLLTSGVSASIRFDNNVVRFDSSRTTRAFDVTAINLAQPGILVFAAAQTGGEPLSGNIEILRSWYTVVGVVGTSVSTSTTISDVIASSQQKLTGQTRSAEGILTVSASGGPTNQAPTASITGPTTGTVGVPVTFSGSQSNDPDGSIVSFAWAFGDGQTGTGVTVAKSYTTAGTYAVRLTVTDAQGATATREQQVVISAAVSNTGSISGTVLSSLGGGLSGVTISVAGGGTTTTAAGGSYALSSVPIGSRAVTVSNVPANCTVPAAQTTTVAANTTSTVNFTVACTTGSGATTGSVQGRVTRASDGSAIGFTRVVVQPTGGVALAAVTTAVDGNYTATGVPVGTGASAGAGSITVTDLPAGCTAPPAQAYSGLAANSSVTVNVAVTCAVATTGSLTGRITRSTGGDAAGVSVVATPNGASALSAVTTNGSGTFTIANILAGSGTLALANLPGGCTAPSDLAYTGVTVGGTLTRNVVLNCVAGEHTYPLTATWGTLTASGPTGRQVTLTIAIDMGSAPGRPDVSGSAADALAGITFQIAYDSTKLAYQSRSLLSPDEFDLGVAGTANGQSTTKITTLAVASTSAQVKTGAFQIVRLTFNIRSGASGSVAPIITVSQAVAGTLPQQVVTNSVIVQALAALVIPP
jgi:PKD domain